jgi:3-methyladenine DNA glycosylase/8-oxoguanine DNA glycosylase
MSESIDVAASRAWVLAHLLPGVDEMVRHDEGQINVTRLVPTGSEWCELTISFPADSVAPISLRAIGSRADEAEAAGRCWLGLDIDPAPAVAALANDSHLGPLVAARPYIRIPGTTDPFETAVFVILGQQVSVAAACRFAGRLVDAYGHSHGRHRSFPRADVLAPIDDDDLRAATGLTGARARTVVALARTVADGLDLTEPAARADLLSLHGIGPWTADLVSLRCARQPDIFLSGDLALRRALGDISAVAADRIADAWRPHRSLAVIHLWTHHVLDPPAQRSNEGGDVLDQFGAGRSKR